MLSSVGAQRANGSQWTSGNPQLSGPWAPWENPQTSSAAHPTRGQKSSSTAPVGMLLVDFLHLNFWVACLYQGLRQYGCLNIVYPKNWLLIDLGALLQFAFGGIPRFQTHQYIQQGQNFGMVKSYILDLAGLNAQICTTRIHVIGCY